MTMFWRELKDNIKDGIMHDERNYESFAKFIEIVINFNNKLYERVIKKRYNQFKKRAEFIYESIAKYAKSKQQLYIKNSKYIEFALMKLDMIHRRKKKEFEKEKKHKRKKLCYECEKTHYFVKNYCNENMMS